MTFPWPWRRKQKSAHDIIARWQSRIVSITELRHNQLLAAEAELFSIRRARSAATTKGNATRAAKRIAAQAATTAALRGEG